MKWELKSELYYAKTHEWVKAEGGNSVVVGITDYAQDKLGDVVFVELPEEGQEVEKGENIAVIESVKAVVDFYAPVKGKVTSLNREVEEKPELLNESPYAEGWIFKMEAEDPQQLKELMDEEQYREHLVKEEEEEN